MNTTEIINRYGIKHAAAALMRTENTAKAIRDCRKALPIHLAHRHDIGPQGALSRQTARTMVGHLRFYQSL